MNRYGSSYGRAMVRGGRSYSSSRGGGYRGSPRGGGSWNGGDGGYGRSSRDRFPSFDNYDRGNKYVDRYSRIDDYPKAYRMEPYSRDRHSPERKRPRTEGPSSRHDSYGSRYDLYLSDRRGYSGDRERHFSSSSSPYRREEFRRPPPPPSPRGSTRGRMSSRGSRGMRRERGGPPRRRMVDRSYVIRKRGLIRSNEYTRRSKLIRLRSTLPRRRRVVSSEKESSGDEKDKSKEPKEKKDKTEKADEDVDKEKKEGEEKEEDEKMEVTEEGGEKKEKSKEKKEKKEGGDEDKDKKKLTNYIKLVCPQCNIRVSTFRRYDAHLQGKTHLFAMRKTAAKQRSILAQMRQAQRNAQNELEKTGENITEHTVFCPLCKLNYKQERKVHQGSAAHKNMKKFLMPLCKVCKITFKSPMVYENHLCSIDHLKRKQRVDNASDAEEDNLDEFTTIDSVGELDENAGSNEDAEKEEKKKAKVSIGIELVKKIEAYYCDLCRMFLPRGTENEYPDILEGHCRKRFHMQRYIRHKENEELKKRAEKLQRKETAEREKKKDDPKKEGENDTSAENSEVKEEPKDDAEPKEGDCSKIADDDKLWEAVDKDLGELLEEGNKSDDDDEDSRVNGERFDRFKSAEKEKNEKEGKVTEEAISQQEEESDKANEEESK